ncbi:MAG: cytochrome bc complex cytochrome b subunit [Chlamydiae bacterium]|nr:cytochrome bc complex cytochrome b subunit [Chlamydiota bacterium]MBI3265626.1 cytochrome bc complex cytochrome b subunit [Chlamydiota bacterium]
MASLDWIRKRFPIEPFEKLLRKKEVPVYRSNLFYYFGGISLLLFGIQVFSGILLLFYYSPHAGGAYESVRFIMNKVQFGWLIRSVHVWSAHLLIASIFIHLFSTFFMRAYRFPREFTWMTGVFLLMLCLGFGFTGYLLPWNELSFFATKVGTEIIAGVPAIGKFIQTVLRGGEEVGDATLGRFFALHVALFPMMVTGLVLIHLIFIQFQGMSTPPALENKTLKTLPFFPNFILRDCIVWSLTLGLVLVLAVYCPPPLGAKADPFAPTPQGIRPEWYFMWMFQTLKMLPGHILALEGEQAALLVMGILGAGLLFIPWLDIWTRRGKRYSPLTYLGWVILIYMIFTTILGYLHS